MDAAGLNIEQEENRFVSAGSNVVANSSNQSLLDTDDVGFVEFVRATQEDVVVRALNGRNAGSSCTFNWRTGLLKLAPPGQGVGSIQYRIRMVSAAHAEIIQCRDSDANWSPQMADMIGKFAQINDICQGCCVSALVMGYGVKRWRRELLERVPVNRAGVPMALGLRSISHRFYCGRRLGRCIFPVSYAQCGPDDGPQCLDCEGYTATNPPIEDLHVGARVRLSAERIRVMKADELKQHFLSREEGIILETMPRYYVVAPVRDFFTRMNYPRDHLDVVQDADLALCNIPTASPVSEFVSAAELHKDALTNCLMYPPAAIAGQCIPEEIEDKMMNNHRDRNPPALSGLVRILEMPALEAETLHGAMWQHQRLQLVVGKCGLVVASSECSSANDIDSGTYYNVNVDGSVLRLNYMAIDGGAIVDEADTAAEATGSLLGSRKSSFQVGEYVRIASLSAAVARSMQERKSDAVPTPRYPVSVWFQSMASHLGHEGTIVHIGFDGFIRVEINGIVHLWVPELIETISHAPECFEEHVEERRIAFAVQDKNSAALECHDAGSPHDAHDDIMDRTRSVRDAVSDKCDLLLRLGQLDYRSNDFKADLRQADLRRWELSLITAITGAAPHFANRLLWLGLCECPSLHLDYAISAFYDYGDQWGFDAVLGAELPAWWSEAAPASGARAASEEAVSSVQEATGLSRESAASLLARFSSCSPESNVSEAVMFYCEHSERSELHVRTDSWIRKRCTALAERYRNDWQQFREQRPASAQAQYAAYELKKLESRLMWLDELLDWRFRQRNQLLEMIVSRSCQTQSLARWNVIEARTQSLILADLDWECKRLRIKNVDGLTDDIHENVAELAGGLSLFIDEFYARSEGLHKMQIDQTKQIYGIVKQDKNRRWLTRSLRAMQWYEGGRETRQELFIPQSSNCKDDDDAVFSIGAQESILNKLGELQKQVLLPSLRGPGAPSGLLDSLLTWAVGKPAMLFCIRPTVPQSKPQSRQLSRPSPTHTTDTHSSDKISRNFCADFSSWFRRVFAWREEVSKHYRLDVQLSLLQCRLDCWLARELARCYHLAQIRSSAVHPSLIEVIISDFAGRDEVMQSWLLLQLQRRSRGEPDYFSRSAIRWHGWMLEVLESQQRQSLWLDSSSILPLHLQELRQWRGVVGERGHYPVPRARANRNFRLQYLLLSPLCCQDGEEGGLRRSGLGKVENENSGESAGEELKLQPRIEFLIAELEKVKSHALGGAASQLLDPAGQRATALGEQRFSVFCQFSSRVIQWAETHQLHLCEFESNEMETTMQRQLALKMRTWLLKELEWRHLVESQQRGSASPAEDLLERDAEIHSWVVQQLSMREEYHCTEQQRETERGSGEWVIVHRKLDYWWQCWVLSVLEAAQLEQEQRRCVYRESLSLSEGSNPTKLSEPSSNTDTTTPGLPTVAVSTTTTSISAISEVEVAVTRTAQILDSELSSPTSSSLAGIEDFEKVCIYLY